MQPYRGPWFEERWEALRTHRNVRADRVDRVRQAADQAESVLPEYGADEGPASLQLLLADAKALYDRARNGHGGGGDDGDDDLDALLPPSEALARSPVKSSQDTATTLALTSPATARNPLSSPVSVSSTDPLPVRTPTGTPALPCAIVRAAAALASNDLHRFCSWRGGQPGASASGVPRR